MTTRLDLPSGQQRSDFAEVAIATVAGLALTVTLLLIFTIPIAGKLAANRDFVAYWATGRLLVQHGNPYDFDAVSALEQSAGLDAPPPGHTMRNPPWALPIAYPLGFLGIRIAAILWTLLLLACLLISVYMLHQLQGSPPNRIHWLGFAFTPAIICVIMGQTSLFALLGLVLFLRFHRCHPFSAGAALWLCALKPHLFLPFAAVLAVWIVFSRSYKLLAGAAAALALSTAVAYLVDPTAWPDYSRMMLAPAPVNQFSPCLAYVMRHWFLPQATWLQYLPVALACVWALIYFWPRRARWDWLSGSSPIILVSLLAAPYLWFYDQCLAIPALLSGAYATRSRKVLAALALLILATDIEICFVRISSNLFLWTVPAWLIWYLFARATTREQPTSAPN